MDFELKAKYQPAGDQAEAIKKLQLGFKSGFKEQTLLGVTGSGKTFTMANLVASLNKPTLVISHNKTLAAQLASEFQDFFPNNAVHYFVSYYDYYQPEAYLPASDTYIEKETQINEEIDRLRHVSTQSLLTRSDVLIVASVSCIYNLGSPLEYNNYRLNLQLKQIYHRFSILKQLNDLQYQRNDVNLVRASYNIKNVLAQIKNDVKLEVASFLENGKLVEAERLKIRVNHDLEMMEQTGYCNGIENYSRYFSGKEIGDPPTSLLEYFPEDFLLLIDESHMTIPQIRGMYLGDKARKENLVDFGFRLSAAYDNRPLKFSEFQKYIKQTIYVSATPAEFELTRSQQIVEQIIRPTYLLDPEISVRPQTGQLADLIKEIQARVEKKQRILVTVLTKRLAEDLAEILLAKNIKVQYLHSEVKTLDRIQILHDLRSGKYDVLVGVNLLREGLDLPEVSLVAILDADKEGFLRSKAAFI